MSETDNLSLLWEIGPKFVDGSPHCVEMGIEFVSVNIGRATMRLPYSKKLTGNPRNRVIHGGAVTALLDHSMGLAATSRFNPLCMVATLNLSIDYMRAPRPGDTILASAECYKTTRSIAFVRAIAHTGDIDDPVALGQATFVTIGTLPREQASSSGENS